MTSTQELADAGPRRVVPDSKSRLSQACRILGHMHSGSAQRATQEILRIVAETISVNSSPEITNSSFAALVRSA